MSQKSLKQALSIFWLRIDNREQLAYAAFSFITLGEK